MRLLRLHVENFGKLQDLHLSFEETLHVLYRENGWGKSTLAAFIKAMLFGMPSSTKRALDENERKKYLPWQGGAYGGSLELECRAGRFRIERFFGAKESGDSFALYDLTTNQLSNAFHEQIGQELLGIDADGFIRTVYLSQHAVPAKGDNNSITAKLSDLLDDVDDVGSFDSAMALLEKRRKHYVMSGDRGRIADLQREIEANRTQLERLAQTEARYRACEEERLSLNASIAQAEAELKQTREQLSLAGLARERAAYRAQQVQMQEEIANVRASIEQWNVRFRNRIPTAEELEQQKQLWMSIAQTRARMDEIANAPCHHEAYEILQSDRIGSLPAAVWTDQMTDENAELQELVHRERYLMQNSPASEVRCFEEHRPPTEANLQAAFVALDRAEAARNQAAKQQALARTRAQKGKLLAVLFALLGVAGLAISFLPAVGGGLAGAMIGGACLLFCTALACFLFIGRGGTVTSRDDGVRELEQVRALLARYGMNNGDPRSRLTELSMLAKRYGEEMRVAEKHAHTLEQTRQKKQEAVRLLRERFLMFEIHIDGKNDYRNDIEALRRDLARYQRGQAERNRRNQQYRQAEERYDRLYATLLPFLARYGEEETTDPAACLERFAAGEREYRRLQREEREKDATLRRFIAEKQLHDPQAATEATLDYDALTQLEKQKQVTLSELLDQRVKLLAQMDRLLLDLDTLPEEQARATSLEEELALARENSTTIANTMKYLEEAKTALSVRYLDGMQKSFSELLEQLIEAAPPESVMDPSFDVKLREGGKTQSLESFSQGWRDAVRFCIRLSLTEALYEGGEAPFLILDDPFVNLDDRRMEAAKRLLVSLSQRYQIIYMVCHTDRK